MRSLKEANSVRNTQYLKLLRSGSIEAAAKINDDLRSSFPNELLFARDRLSLELKRKNFSSVVPLALAVFELAQDDPESLAQAIQATILSKDFNAARTLARSARPLWLESPRLSMLSMKALERSGEIEEAVEVAEVLLSRDGASDKDKAAVARIFWRSGMQRRSAEIFRTLVYTSVNDPQLLNDAAKAAILVDNDINRGIKFLGLALGFDPDHIQAKAQLAATFEDTERPDEAVRLLQSIAPAQRSMGHRRNLARLLMAMGRSGEARSILEESLVEDCDNEGFRKLYLTGLLSDGKPQLASAFLEKARKDDESKLPSSFTEMIERITAATHKYRPPLGRMRWLYGELQKTGTALPPFDEWSCEMGRTDEVDRALLKWAICRKDQTEQILERIVGLKEAGEVVKSNPGCIITGAHVGLLFAGPIALHGLGIEGAWVASIPSVRSPDHLSSTQTLISVTTTPRARVAREILRNVKQGVTVGIAIDGMTHQQPTNGHLFDQEVGFSEFPAAVSYKEGVKTFFPKIFWVDGSIKVALEELPDRLPSESMAAFIERWRASFLDKLGTVLLEQPKQARFTGGFWNRVIY